MLDPEARVVREQRVRTTAVALRQALGDLPASRVVLEAGPRSPWLSRLLAELGHEVIVANVRQVALIARSHRKDDRIDAELLAPIRHRGARAQQDLAVVRSRDALVRARTQLINHVRGAVKAWGAALPGSTAPAFHRTAAEHIPAELRTALLPLLEVIGELSARIAAAGREVEALCAAYPETAALRQVAGVGPITALTFVLTIEDPARFPRSREVAPYLGLVPRRRDSGGRHTQLGITKRGDSHLRRLLVQAAQYVLGPFGPDCDLRRWGERYMASGAGNAKKRAVVAGEATTCSSPSCCRCSSTATAVWVRLCGSMPMVTNVASCASCMPDTASNLNSGMTRPLSSYAVCGHGRRAGYARATPSSVGKKQGACRPCPAVTQPRIVARRAVDIQTSQKHPARKRADRAAPCRAGFSPGYAPTSSSAASTILSALTSHACSSTGLYGTGLNGAARRIGGASR